MADPLCFKIPEFLERAKISRTAFYKRCAQGAGPRLIKLGKSTLITAEAAHEWFRQLEEESGPAVAAMRERMKVVAPKKCDPK